MLKKVLALGHPGPSSVEVDGQDITFDSVFADKSELICPITHEVMRDPVQLGDFKGHVFDEVGIRSWLERSMTNPISGKAIPNGFVRITRRRDIYDRIEAEKNTVLRMIDRLMELREFETAWRFLNQICPGTRDFWADSKWELFSRSSCDYATISKIFEAKISCATALGMIAEATRIETEQYLPYRQNEPDTTYQNLDRDNHADRLPLDEPIMVRVQPIQPVQRIEDVIGQSLFIIFVLFMIMESIYRNVSAEHHQPQRFPVDPAIRFICNALGQCLDLATQKLPKS